MVSVGCGRGMIDDMSGEQVVRDNPALERYELVVGERVIGIADYRVTGEVAVLPHTEIDLSQRGQGWGAVLVRGTLDDLRARGLRVEPQCWFVAEFVQLNPEYADLVAVA